MRPGAMTAKEVLKRIVLRTCPPRLQRRLRRAYTVHQIMHDRHSREPEMALIRSLVANGSAVADIGANVGVYTKELSSAVGAKGKVYAFEPLLENYDILTALLSKGRMNNVIPFRAALGSRVTESEIVIPEMKGFLGLYWAHLAQPGDNGRREKVDVLTLDELAKRQVITHLDFVKCDVEGGELEVLRGGLDLVRSCRPAWLMEVSRETCRDVFGLFSELGYQAFVYSDRLIPVDGYRDREFSNYFFLHPQQSTS
jgi:FkbM family methyltransferase